MKIFQGDSADTVWKKAATALSQEGGSSLQLSRRGLTKEILHATFVLHSPKQRWTVSRIPAINPAFALIEVLWIVSGRRDAKLPNYWNRSLPSYAGKGEIYHGAYGHRLRHHYGFDQLERAYQAFLSNPDSRQVVLQIWDPRADFPNSQGESANPDIPCNVLAIPKLRNGRLEWLQILRSNDLYLGVPYNFIQFTSLQEIFAGWLGVEVGTYTHVSDSLHLYENDLEKFQVGYFEPAHNSDTLALSWTDSKNVIFNLLKYLDELIANDVSQGKLKNISSKIFLPDAYQNLMRVIVSEIARRRGWLDEADEIMGLCTNPCLNQIWSLWQDRFRRNELSES